MGEPKPKSPQLSHSASKSRYIIFYYQVLGVLFSLVELDRGTPDACTSINPVAISCIVRKKANKNNKRKGERGKRRISHEPVEGPYVKEAEEKKKLAHPQVAEVRFHTS